MPIQIVRNDITKMKVDAIVNAGNNRLARGGGVCGAIHQAAGPQLEAECLKLGGCKTGDAKITQAYQLPCKYVIHTVGPVWHGGMHGEKALLTSCYQKSLSLAQTYGCESIAFPMVSAGIYGYPKDQALKTAMNAVSEFLFEHDCDMMVYLVMFTKESVQIGNKLFSSITQYIDDHYVDQRYGPRREAIRSRRMYESLEFTIPEHSSSTCWADEVTSPLSLEDALKQVDESFSQMVLRKIKEKGIKNSECYKKANLDKKLFSKIINDIHYSPKKTTAVALAIALGLPLTETNELLSKAGYTLSHSNRFDIIIEYCITHGIYNVHEVNIILDDFDQVSLGACTL